MQLFISYFVATLPLYIPSKFYRYKTRIYISKVMSFHAKILLKILNADIKVKGELIDFRGMIVSNHLSYIDILIVAIFPEATSTEGEEVRRFKRPLFNAAIESGAKILPISLNYTEVNGKKISIKNRDLICWYGDMSFGLHFKELLQTKSILVELGFLDSVDLVNMTAKKLSICTHEAILKEFSPYTHE